MQLIIPSFLTLHNQFGSYMIIYLLMATSVNTAMYKYTDIKVFIMYSFLEIMRELTTNTKQSLVQLINGTRSYTPIYINSTELKNANDPTPGCNVNRNST